ncbi:MAG: hypothetical protein IT173_11910 [Acidobacteria bacterium]|nr:hypothetical protein [Acidobacteriota bacterium]
MRLSQTLLLSVVLCLGASSIVSGQQSIALPSDLTENSSIEEVLSYLDTTIFPEARIGLESNAPGAEPDEIPTTGTRYYEQAFFSKGFKLAKTDGCTITLRNDDVDLLGFSTKYPNPEKGSLDNWRRIKTEESKYVGVFLIPLNILKANKPPYRHTKKADRAALLGTWRTEFTFGSGGWGSLIPRIPKIKFPLENMFEVIGVGPNGKNDSMNGDEITFTFDDKQMSENFFGAFSRAIDLCKGK